VDTLPLERGALSLLETQRFFGGQKNSARYSQVIKTFGPNVKRGFRARKIGVRPRGLTQSNNSSFRFSRRQVIDPFFQKTPWNPVKISRSNRSMRVGGSVYFGSVKFSSINSGKFPGLGFYDNEIEKSVWTRLAIDVVRSGSGPAGHIVWGLSYLK
jgi:hypothetical protein